MLAWTGTPRRRIARQGAEARNGDVQGAAYIFDQLHGAILELHPDYRGGDVIGNTVRGGRAAVQRGGELRVLRQQRAHHRVEAEVRHEILLGRVGRGELPQNAVAVVDAR